MNLRIIAALLMVFGLASPAYAYLDPGTGSFVLQMVLASIVAVGASIKVYWHTIKQSWHTIKQSVQRLLSRGSAKSSETK